MSEQIFEKIIQHMIKGLMVHEQMADYYDFLNLQGYKRCHEYHCITEACNYRKTCRFYINYYNKLVPEMPVENPRVIPNTWYNYTRQEVDTSTKRSAVKKGIETWCDWEKETKELYEKCYKELTETGDIKAAKFVEGLICDVSYELKKVYRYHLNLKAVDYDIVYIVESQKSKHKKYKKKTEEFSICL